MQFDQLKRREFTALLGGAAAWPLAVRAQQPAMSVVGYLSASSPAAIAHQLTALRLSLSEAGYVEGRNLAIDYRFAEGQYDRLPIMAEELVRRQAAVIIATSTTPSLVAKRATATIPIVFGSTDDPVELGLVASLARPGGNATGVHFRLSELGAKHVGLLQEIVPAAARIGLLVNPDNANAEAVTKEVTAAASTIAAAIDVVRASDRSAIDAAFATLVRSKADGLLVGADPFLFSRRLQLATLATRHAIPAIYPVREYADVGGLISYGTSLIEVWRQIGTYAGRILKGAKPADLPVMRSSKFELIINAQTARALGLKISDNLLTLADEVIE
jgi:putative ABC transport system substrate-binding protein